MKTRKILVLIVAFVITSNISFAQKQKKLDSKVVAQKEQAIKKKFGESWQFSYSDEYNNLKRMRGKHSISGALSSEADATSAAFSALNEIIELLAIPVSDFKVDHNAFDGYLNRYEIILQQYFKGVPVEDGNVYFSIHKNGELYNITNHTFPFLELETQPILSQKDAITQLLAYKNYSFFNKESPKIQLIILPFNFIKDNTVEKLCYKVIFNERTIFIDANNGEIIIDYSNYIEDNCSNDLKNVDDNIILNNISNSINSSQVESYIPLNYKYSGTIKGEVYPVKNPEGSIGSEELEGVYIWFNYAPLNPLTWSHDIITITDGTYFYESNEQLNSFRTKLKSNRIEVKNDQGSELEHTYDYLSGDATYNYTFPDATSPGHEANVYYNLTEQLKWFDITYTSHTVLPSFSALTNHNFINAPGFTTNGDCDGSSVRYSADGGRSSHVIRHECIHYFVFHQNGNNWITSLTSKDYQCMNEAFPQYLSAASRENSSLLNGIDIGNIISIEDKVEPIGEKNELDHDHYENRNAVASAWWAIRNSMGSTDFNILLYNALDQIDTKITTRDFYNILLDQDDTDGDPLTPSKNFKTIVDAYADRGMYYYPKIESVDDAGSPKAIFADNDDIYVNLSRCPTNEPVRVYIVKHKSKWGNKDNLTDVSGGFETINIETDGSKSKELIWKGENRSGSGAFDIIVDVNNNGEYDFDFDERIDGRNSLYVGAGLQVALSIDRSGSMSGSFLDMAKSASMNFVDLMQLNDYLVITSFSNGGYINYPFTQLSTIQDKINAKNAISSISSYSMTSIGAGLQVAQGELNKGNTNKPQGIILLSDGYENTSPYISQILPSIRGNTDIYTIALGTGSDENLLNSIAAATGGFYSYAPTTDRLSMIYNTIKAKVTGQQTIDYFEGLIAQGQTLLRQAYIEAGAILVNFIITWPGSDLDLELIDPLGNVIGHNSNYSNITFSSGSTYEMYTILNPIPGLYTLRITGISVSGLTEDFQINITAESSLNMDVTFNKDMFGLNEPILINANINDGGSPIIGANVIANVTCPYLINTKSSSILINSELDKKELHDSRDKGIASSENINLKSSSATGQFTQSSIILYDDGQHGDGAANDGIYGNYFTETYSIGSYVFDVSASGKAPVIGDFTRTISKATVVTNSQSIIVSEPQTGTIWDDQSEHIVKWSSTNIDGNVNIFLSTDGGNTYPIPLVLDTPDDGAELIKVLVNQSVMCRIKIQSVNYPSIVGLNPGNFTIESKEIATMLSFVGQTEGQYSDPVTLKARLVDMPTGEGVQDKTIKFIIGEQEISATTDNNGYAETVLILDQDPCKSYTVQTIFEQSSPYLTSSDSDPFNIMPEDVEIEYIGVLFQATPGITSKNATVKLIATIREVDDGNCGDITKALVSFINRDGGSMVDCLPVTYFIDPANPITGIVTFDWNVIIPPNENSVVTNLGILVGAENCSSCYFKHNNTEDDALIVAYQPEGDFVTGGGHIMPEYAGGPFASNVITKANFGFNVKYTKKGNKLQGKFTMIIRNGGNVYQIKSNALTSLGTNVSNKTAKIGEFTSKADLKDVTNELAPTTIQGNLILKVTMTDRGEPGITDGIGITLSSSVKVDNKWVADKLLYSSHWSGLKTIEDILTGGNLIVQCGANINVQTTEVPVVQPVGKSKSAIVEKIDLKVYPNPFNEKLYFDFKWHSNTTARLELYDALGQKIETIFNQDVLAGQMYRIEYQPKKLATNMLYYRLIAGDEVLTGKVIYKK